MFDRRTRPMAVLLAGGMLTATLLAVPTSASAAPDTSPGTGSTQAAADRELAAARSGVARVDRELRDLSPFLQARDGVLRLDRDAALRAGRSRAVVELGDELARYQNELIATARRTGESDITKIEISLDRYPKVDDLFTSATARAVERARGAGARPGDGLSLLLVHPCGDFDNPLPNFTPDRPIFGPFADPLATLLADGFHRTALYACGEEGCNDFTRPTGFTGPLGFCAAPRFRDHGLIAFNFVSIQFGEPNPEVLGYILDWPYPTWPAYVSWWHDTF